MAQQANIVPFGKYKGQPVEVLAQDKEYLSWLQQQSWFTEKFRDINTLIINNFGEPAETPEHNKMQAMFTDDSFRGEVVNFAIKQNIFKENDVSNVDGFPALFEQYGFDVMIILDGYGYYRMLIELKPEISDDYPAVLRQIKSKEHYTDYSSGRPYTSKLNGHRLCIADKYTGTGATFRQVWQMFESSGIYLVLLSSITSKRP